jgi:hypothetical protein
MSKVEYIKNPVYVTEDGSAVDCIVKFDTVGVELPFTADLYDVEEHGRAIHAAILAGEAGEIGPYVPPASVERLGDGGPAVL